MKETNWGICNPLGTYADITEVSYPYSIIVSYMHQSIICTYNSLDPMYCSSVDPYQITRFLNKSIHGDPLFIQIFKNWPPRSYKRHKDQTKLHLLHMKTFCVAQTRSTNNRGSGSIPKIFYQFICSLEPTHLGQFTQSSRRRRVYLVISDHFLFFMIGQLHPNQMCNQQEVSQLCWGLSNF